MQTLAYLTNATVKVGMKRYHFRRDASSDAQGAMPETKRPLPAYLLFLAGRRRNAQESCATVTQAAPAAWLALGEDERRTYVEKAEREQLRYVAQLKKYLN